MIFEGLNDEYMGLVETMYPRGLDYLFTKTPDEIWDFFEYLAHDTWEYDNARGTFSSPLSTLICCTLHLYLRVEFRVYLMRILILHVILFHVSLLRCL